MISLGEVWPGGEAASLELHVGTIKERDRGHTILRAFLRNAEHQTAESDSFCPSKHGHIEYATRCCRAHSLFISSVHAFGMGSSPSNNDRLLRSGARVT